MMPSTPLPHGLPHSAAAERNSEPILQVLQTLLTENGRSLEIASGTGQHAAYFAKSLGGWQWQPTDRRPEGFATIAGWAEAVGAANVLPARQLDVLDDQWPSEGEAFPAPFDLIFCANMLHIAPWSVCGALMRGTARHLAPQGFLVTYGPYLEDEVNTAPGNLDFDTDLRARNPAWGIRWREDVEREAANSGLALSARYPMPANNLLLVFRRSV